MEPLATPGQRIYVALDTDCMISAVRLAKQLHGIVGGVKVGSQLYTAHGPDSVRRLVDTGLPVFLDLKFHDIPNTVRAAVHAASRLKVRMLSIHVLGGYEMMAAAREAALASTGRKPLVVGVTLLTSLGSSSLASLGIRERGPVQLSFDLLQAARRLGLDGVTCPAALVRQFRTLAGPSFELVVPGIRPSPCGPNQDDHGLRAADPRAAVEAGADIVVVGRPITESLDPVRAARRIVADMSRRMRVRWRISLC